MAKEVAAGRTSFRRSTVFALDEYGGLSPADPGLCRNMLQSYLLNHVDLPPQQNHAFDPAHPDLTQFCADYERLINDNGGLDLVILGLGMNGHLGINEPGSGLDTPTRRVDLHPMTRAGSAGYLTHDQLPTWGLTLGLRVFMAAKEVWIIVNGSKKAEIVKRVYRGPVGPEVPASQMRAHPNTWLIVDQEAGSLL